MLTGTRQGDRNPKVKYNAYRLECTCGRYTWKLNEEFETPGVCQLHEQPLTYCNKLPDMLPFTILTIDAFQLTQGRRFGIQNFNIVDRLPQPL